MATLSNAPEVNAHFVEVNQFTLLHYPLRQFHGEGSSLLLQTRLMHGPPWYQLPLGEGNTSLLVDFVETVPVEAMQGIHPFQKLCPGPHTEMGPFLHQFPTSDLLEHSISDFWSNIPNLSAVWWMLVVVLDESLNGVIHVHRPASHEICYLGVCTSWVSKVLKATKPKSNHSMPVPDGEASVPTFTVLHWLRYRLQLVATCKPMIPELKCQGIVTLLYLVRIIDVTFVVAASLPLVE
jgi:hypothetical protein